MVSLFDIQKYYAQSSLTNSRWACADARFREIDRRTILSPDVIQDVETKITRVVRSLNQHYYGAASMENFAVAGSLRKGTAIHPLNDVDLFFLLPASIWQRFDAYSAGGQSALLQDVKSIVSNTYPRSPMKGDGQVVVLDTSSVCIEIIPVFKTTSGQLLIADTNQGGSWKVINPDSELEIIEQVDRLFSGRLVKLVRLLKLWKYNCQVPIKSFHLERIAMDTLRRSSYADQDWFDWHFRDALLTLLGWTGGSFRMTGNPSETIELGNAWYSKANMAYQRSLVACDHEEFNRDFSAALEWEKILGERACTQTR